MIFRIIMHVIVRLLPWIKFRRGMPTHLHLQCFWSLRRAIVGHFAGNINRRIRFRSTWIFVLVCAGFAGHGTGNEAKALR